MKSYRVLVCISLFQYCVIAFKDMILGQCFIFISKIGLFGILNDIDQNLNVETRDILLYNINVIYVSAVNVKVN